MPNLFFAREELKFSEEALEQFKNDKTFSPNSKHWSNFLIHYISFIKAERRSKISKINLVHFRENINILEELIRFYLISNVEMQIIHGLEKQLLIYK